MYLKIFTVSFFGHRVINNPLQIEQRLEALLRELLIGKEYVEFLVGRDGDFDQLVSSVVLRCKRRIRDDNSVLVWVMPYETAEYRNNETAYQNYYDEIEICGASATGHFKGAYLTRNRQMIDRSDLVVFCVEHETGGAYQTLRYAITQGKRIVNLAEGKENL